MLKKYTHVVSVEVCGESHVLMIHRVMDGRTDLYSEMDIPVAPAGEIDWDAFDRISSWLGKAICIDSQEVRRCLGIEAAANDSAVTSNVRNGVSLLQFQMRAFIDRDGVLEPFFVTVSAPVRSKRAADFYCEVHTPALLRRDTEIFGADAAQAHVLAIEFIKSMLGEVKLVDEYRRPVSFPPNNQPTSS